MREPMLLMGSPGAGKSEQMESRGEEMKLATYHKVGGGKFTVEYDENAPRIVCGEPVIEASVGGTVICPWCDMGHCRYCGVQLPMGIKAIKEHMAWRKSHPVKEVMYGRC